MHFSFQLIFLLSSFLFASNIYAQSSTSTVIEEIRFEGLKKTDLAYLSQFLDLQENDSATNNDIERNVQHIKNVTGIRNAFVTIDTIKNKLQLTYNIEEVRTLLPVINLGGIKGNLWYEIGFSDYNWKGKGQLLNASYQNNNGLHSGQVYYKVPMIGKSKWGYSAALSSWNSEEPLYFDEGTVNYRYQNNSIAGSIIRNFSNKRNFEFGGTFFIEKYKKSENQFLEVVPGPEALTQHKLLTKLIYTQDQLNYHLFYRTGHAFSVAYQNVYNSDDKSLFNSLQIKGIKYFRPKKKINLAFRLILGLSTNNDTPFAPFVADSHVNIRGIGNRIDRGTAQVVLNAEYRHTLFHKKQWSAQFVAFTDIGNWRTPGGDLSQLVNTTYLRQFVGGGFRLIYQKVFGAVLRIDYGVDVFNPYERGLVIGVGQYF